MKSVPVFKPLIEKEEFAAAHGALELGWLGMGSYVGEFEQKIKEFTNATDRHVACVSTGHAALHLALMLIGAKAGDEIITPSFNNIADFQAITAVGASPVFCDIDINTLCIDLNKVESLITPKTKAIIVMDYDCILCDHDRVQEIAKKHNLRVIHDAAHSIGSKYKGKMVGSFSDITMFSFDPVKTITSIDGGALIVRTEEELKQLHEMRLIGMGQSPALMYQNQRAWSYDVSQLGFRYHMSNMHAALGLAQIGKFDVIAKSRNATAIRYSEKLKTLKQVVVPQSDFKDITPFLYYIRVLNDKRQDLRDYLKERGIDTGIHWQPGHTFTLFKDARKGDLSVTEQIGNEVLSLPFHSKMSDESVDYIVSHIFEFFKS